MILFYIVVVGALVGTFIALMRDTFARSVLFVAWISIIVFLCIFSTDIYGYYDLILQKIKEVIENFDKYRSAAIFYCTLAALVGTIIGFILGRGRNWPWSRRLWGHIKKNPPIVLLLIAWVFIVLALWFFGSDLLELYQKLSKQIEDKPETDIEYRGIAIRYFGIIAAAGTVIGYIVVTARNIISDNQNKAADEQNKINERGRITESIGQAITQIGAFNGDNPNIEVRLGGIYSLERIAKNSDDDYKKIMDILCAYVRVTAPIQKPKSVKKKKQEDKKRKIREDIQAAVDVLGTKKELNLVRQRDEFRVNLENCDLSNSRFSELNFNRGTDSNNGAIFDDSLFEKSEFHGADLSYVSFDRAILIGANFEYARLKGARFLGATFKDTKVHGADFSKAKKLTQEQVDEMIGDIDTKLPNGLKLSRIEESPKLKKS